MHQYSTSENEELDNHQEMENMMISHHSAYSSWHWTFGIITWIIIMGMFISITRYLWKNAK